MMQYILLSWQSAISIINKHKVLSIIMLGLITILMVTFGMTFFHNNRIAENVNSYENAYGDKIYYFTNEALDDLDYHSYLQNSNVDDYKRLLELKRLLDREDTFTFITIVNQPISVDGNCISEEYLYGYESGQVSSMVKSIQVSSSFFKEFNINISEGELFTEDDYIFESDKNIPVLLGSAYKEFYKIGDVFSGKYLVADVNWEVIGFLDNRAFFNDGNSDEFISCERYVVMPAMEVITESPVYFDKIMLLQQMGGVIVSDKEYVQLDNQYQELVKKAGLQKWDLYIRNPEAAEVDINDVVKAYSAMTKEVSKQFETILIILAVFVVISITITLCGFVREQHYTYGVCLLCGASYKKLAQDILCFTGIIILSGFVLATVILVIVARMSLETVGLVALLSVGIWILSVSIPVIYLSRMDIQDIIGGRE